jgi:hypothetical protein
LYGVVFVIVMLFSSFAIAAHADSALYEQTVFGGGPYSSTESWYLGHCRVWMHTVITTSLANGHPRNNPDGTFYPADAFSYSFVYGWDGDPLECRNLSVCDVRSVGILPEGSGRCGRIVERKASESGRSYAISGVAEISQGKMASGHLIELQVNAERWGCYYPQGTPHSCGWSGISAVGRFTPSVIRPDVKVGIWHENLFDLDGYESANIDGTYYVWDAINIVHNPLYKWKQQRMGTISVKVTKESQLNMEKEFQCESSKCSHTLYHDGFEPWHREYEYGGGVTLYNASENQIRQHAITYTADIYNLGKLIERSENKTRPLVVSYEPVYSSYPYLVLKDGGWWGWSNRHAVALQYDGSVGSGQDDRPGLHQNRRSKINGYVYEGYAFDPILRVGLNETLSWSSSEPAAFFSEQCGDAKSDPDSLDVQKSGTAMFVNAGWGKVSFSYPIVKTMLEKRYVNATTHNVLQSVNFAGYVVKDLTEYKYQYPDAKFFNSIKILTYDSQGLRTDMPVELTMIPDLKRGAQYVQDYTCSKVLYDTANPMFASIAASDMFARENVASGHGYVNLKAALTSIWFPKFYSAIVDEPLKIPLRSGYSAPSPYELTIKVGQNSRTITGIMSFLSPFVHVVNLDPDNRLSVMESTGFARIIPDEKFGTIEKVEINGRVLEENCTEGCTVVIQQDVDTKIVAWNAWGGVASYHTRQNTASVDADLGLDLALVFATALLAGIILVRLSLRAFRFKLS